MAAPKAATATNMAVIGFDNIVTHNLCNQPIAVLPKSTTTVLKFLNASTIPSSSLIAPTNCIAACAFSKAFLTDSLSEPNKAIAD